MLLIGYCINPSSGLNGGDEDFWVWLGGIVEFEFGDYFFGGMGKGAEASTFLHCGEASSIFLQMILQNTTKKDIN